MVAFDLDGTGRKQHYGWVRPDTAILVWDGDKTSKVTSGRQLFGSVTWWLFFNNGYQALATLDDNHDGQLSGTELNGLALWFDRNENGISDPGEVIPLSSTPIASIMISGTMQKGNTVFHQNGIRLQNGLTLPTYDWVATPR